jgi:hypothetical protein
MSDFKRNICLLRVLILLICSLTCFTCEPLSTGNDSVFGIWYVVKRQVPAMGGIDNVDTYYYSCATSQDIYVVDSDTVYLYGNRKGIWLPDSQKEVDSLHTERWSLAYKVQNGELNAVDQNNTTYLFFTKRDTLIEMDGSRSYIRSWSVKCSSAWPPSGWPWPPTVVGNITYVDTSVHN